MQQALRYATWDDTAICSETEYRERHRQVLGDPDMHGGCSSASPVSIRRVPPLSPMPAAAAHSTEHFLPWLQVGGL